MVDLQQGVPGPEDSPDIRREGEQKSAAPRTAVPIIIRAALMVMEGEWRGLLAHLPAVEAVGFKGAILEAEGPQEAVVTGAEEDEDLEACLPVPAYPQALNEERGVCSPDESIGGFPIGQRGEFIR